MRARLTLSLMTAAVLLSGLFGFAGLAAADASPSKDTASGGWFSGAVEVVDWPEHDVVALQATDRAQLADVAAKIVAPPPPPPPPVDDPATFLFPANGPITSQYGQRWGRPHTGVDIDAPTGSAIVAAQGGTVTLAGWKNGYGNTVIIDHGNGVSTLYAHQARLGVTNGQTVERGQFLGTVGATGNVTAAHLHYEVHVGGVPRNPGPWL